MPRLLRHRSNLASTHTDLGRAADALPLVERALQITEAALGPDHPNVATALGNLASIYKELGRAADALPLDQWAVQITEAVLGPDHPDMAIRLGNLAVTYRKLGRATRCRCSSGRNTSHGLPATLLKECLAIAQLIELAADPYTFATDYLWSD